MRRLKVYVHVPDDLGNVHAFGPADEVPDWAARAITNPDVWAEDEPTTSPATGDDESAATAGASSPPPRSGAGSGRDAWAAYARAHGFEVADDVGRDGIIGALEVAGIATE